MKRLAAPLFVLLLAAPVAAQTFGTQTFTEDFESFTLTGLDPETKPDKTWYNYRDINDLGNVTNSEAIEGTQALVVESPFGVSLNGKSVAFDLARPVALNSTTFFLNATSIAENGDGSNVFLTIQSSAPRRNLAGFYVSCTNATFPNGCSLNVRFRTVDTFGQELVPASLNQTEFKIQLVFDWFNGEYQLFVDDADDGVFPFIELPSNIQRFQIGQWSAETPMDAVFDNWTVVGALNGTTGAVTGDVATGIKNFLTAINFTGTASKFLFGVILFVILIAAVLLPAYTLGRDNTITPAIAYFAALVALWLIQMEIWPDWIGIALIIAASAIVALLMRRGVLGIQDASQGAGIVVGSLGYFIIASTFLALSGYAGDTIQLPTGDPSLDTTDTDPANKTSQNFVTSVIDCSVGIVSFGLLGDCDSDTEGKAISFTNDFFDTVGGALGTIFNYAKAGFSFLFQLLTFQLPIPVVFNMMIVLPPAAGLATFAIQTIRGTG